MGTVGHGVNPNNASNRENRIEMEVVKPKTWLLIAKVEPQAWGVKSRCWLKAMGGSETKRQEKERQIKICSMVRDKESLQTGNRRQITWSPREQWEPRENTGVKRFFQRPISSSRTVNWLIIIPILKPLIKEYTPKPHRFSQKTP